MPTTVNGIMACFSYGLIAASKKDPVITHEVTQSKNAGEDAGSWSNRLWPASTCGKVNAFTRLRKHLGQMRAFHYANTYIWEDELWRLLPNSRIEAYKQIVEVDGKKLASDLLEEFLTELPAMIDLARLGRGDSFREADYPTPEEVRRKFYYEVKFRPLPDTRGLNPNLFSETIRELEELNQRRLQEANTALVARLMEPFKTLTDQLATPDKPRRITSVLGTIMEVVDLIPTLDLNGNSELQALAREVKEKFTPVSAEMIKKDEEMAKMVGSVAANVVATLQSFSAIGQRKFA